MTLMEKYNPGRRPLYMSERMKEAAHLFLPRGKYTRKQAPDHPSSARQSGILVSEYGREKRKNRKSVIFTSERSDLIRKVVTSTKISRLRNQQKAHPWRIHQSVSSNPKRF